MTRPVRSRVLATPLAVALALTMTLSACSRDEPEPGPTSPTETATTEPTTPTPSRTPSETATTPAPTQPPTQSPSPATPPATQGPGATDTPPAGGGADELAAFLPEGFPIPEELTITGDPSRTDAQSAVTFTVPDPAATFEFYATELPKAGYTLLPGSSDHYSTEVASGAILAQSDDYSLNLLIVDDEVQVGLTRR